MLYFCYRRLCNHHDGLWPVYLTCGYDMCLVMLSCTDWDLSVDLHISSFIRIGLHISSFIHMGLHMLSFIHTE